MITLSMIFALFLAAVIQALWPTWSAMGQAKVPLLLAVALYYAMNYHRRVMLQAAILAGLFQDALSLMPPGYSCFCFCAVCLVAARFKDVVFEQQWMTHVVFGALAASAANVLLYVLLAKDGLLGVPLLWLFLKLLGSVLLGGIFVPVVFRLLARLDEYLGNEVWRTA